MKNTQTSVVVLGAGYAGLLFTARLAGKTSRRSIRITLVNESDTFTERVRLHQFAANRAIQRRPIADVLRGTGVEVLQGRVTGILPARREVLVERQHGPEEQSEVEHLRYDYLVYALGSVIDRHSVAGVDTNAYTLAPRGPLSAAALREALPALQAAGGHVVVSGGGPTGIETAAELATAYPGLKVHLVTDGALGMQWGNGVAAYIRRSLARSGVTIIDGVSIAEVRADSVITAQGESIPCDLSVWAGGFVALPLAREAGLPVNERGQMLVDPFMRALSHPEIYAIGDAAYPHEEPGVPVRMCAFTAAILGAHAADSLGATLWGRTPRPLSFAYVGQGIALGRHDAIGFNNYPDDRPNPPYFTGRLGYEVREAFVRYLAAAPAIERRLPGSFFWLGKGRYAATQRRLRGRSQKEQRERVQLHQA